MSKEKTVAEPINIGDHIEIIGYGFQRANGSGEIADGRGWIRTVRNVIEDVYEIFNEETGVITGYYPRESIKKIKEEEIDDEY